MTHSLYYQLPGFISDSDLRAWASINNVAHERSQNELLPRLTKKIQETVADMIRRYSIRTKHNNTRDYKTCFCSSTEAKIIYTRAHQDNNILLQ